MSRGHRLTTVKPQVLERHGEALLARPVGEDEIGLELDDLLQIGVETAADDVDLLARDSYGNSAG